MSRHVLLLALAVVASGCYFEGSVAYHPRISQSVSAPADTTMVATGSGGGWSAGINIGFYLDVQLPHPIVTGAAIGLGPTWFNGYGIQPKGYVAKVATKATTLRAELGLPFRPLGVFHTRAVFIHNWLRSTSTTIAPEMAEAETKSAGGRSWFLGPSIGFRAMMVQGESHGFFVVTLSAGVEHIRADLTTKDDRAVHLSSTGVGVRLLISPAFIGHPPKTAAEYSNTGGVNVNTGPKCGYKNDPQGGSPTYTCE
jgi:hypothetical protein